MAQFHKNKNRVEVRPKGRKGFELALFVNGREVMVSSENYRSENSAIKGAKRLSERLSEAYFVAFSGEDFLG